MFGNRTTDVTVPASVNAGMGVHLKPNFVRASPPTREPIQPPYSDGLSEGSLCPACGSLDATLLGQLGALVWVRCISCGLERSGAAR